MQITFKIAENEAEEVSWCKDGNAASLTAEKVLAGIGAAAGIVSKELLQTSLRPVPPGYSPTANGFVDAVTRAYNSHHNLVIRPDDLWTCILCQLNLYVNAHAEELRSKFVAHEGQKELEIIAGGTRYTVDFGQMASQMAKLLKENIVDESLHEWIIPNFTTTTSNDTVICSVVMMSTLQAYFSYRFTLRCGIPAITINGTKDDYSEVLRRLDRLEEFGKEPAAFADLLRPIVSQFVQAFDQPDSPNLEFWSKICHWKSGGSGPSYLGGWITAFCVWNAAGKWQGGKLALIREPLPIEQVQKGRSAPPPPLVLAGMRYPVVDTQDIPSGFCQVPVLLDDNGSLFNCSMVAGHVGNVALKRDSGHFDTIQPSSEWFMFIKGEPNTKKVTIV